VKEYWRPATVDESELSAGGGESDLYYEFVVGGCCEELRAVRTVRRRRIHRVPHLAQDKQHVRFVYFDPPLASPSSVHGQALSDCPSASTLSNLAPTVKAEFR
jgi:hypothetical protein